MGYLPLVMPQSLTNLKRVDWKRISSRVYVIEWTR